MSLARIHINRRIFLKLCTTCVAWTTTILRRQTVSADNINVTTASIPYGKGQYGQGSYPGFQKVYLPLIKKEQT